MAGIDPYAWFANLQDYLVPTTQEIYYAQQEAEHRNCGYTMEKGKPGTFRANAWVPQGQIIVMDADTISRGMDFGFKFD